MGVGLGLTFDLLEGGLEQVALFLAAPVLERPGIEKGDHNGEAGEAKADHPVNNEGHIPQSPLHHRLPADQHCHCGQQNDSAEPAAAGSSVKSHARKVAQEEGGREGEWNDGRLEDWNDGMME